MTVDEDRAPWDAAWAAALDEMELDLDRAALLLRSGEPAVAAGPRWQPPAGIGPLPAGLLERARALHARQLAMATAIAETITGVRRQSAFAARVETGRGQPRPAFVDTAC